MSRRRRVHLLAAPPDGLTCVHPIGCTPDKLRGRDEIAVSVSTCKIRFGLLGLAAGGPRVGGSLRQLRLSSLRPRAGPSRSFALEADTRKRCRASAGQRALVGWISSPRKLRGSRL